MNDGLQLLFARVVESSFASFQENIVKIGFDDWGNEEGIRRNEVKIDDESSCMCLKWRCRSGEKQKEDCLRLKKKGENWTKGWKL